MDEMFAIASGFCYTEVPLYYTFATYFHLHRCSAMPDNDYHQALSSNPVRVTVNFRESLGRHEISIKSLALGEVIGQGKMRCIAMTVLMYCIGAFGRVFKGEYYSDGGKQQVAVKTLKSELIGKKYLVVHLVILSRFIFKWRIRRISERECCDEGFLSPQCPGATGCGV